MTNGTSKTLGEKRDYKFLHLPTHNLKGAFNIILLSRNPFHCKEVFLQLFSTTIANEMLTKSSKAVILLYKKFCTGEISITDNAKAVWGSNPVYQVHKLDNFRTNFNRIKSEKDGSHGNQYPILDFYLIFIQLNIYLTPTNFYCIGDLIEPSAQLMMIVF